MNKKLLAVAVAGVFAAPAAFAQSSVTISGMFKGGYENLSYGNYNSNNSRAAPGVNAGNKSQNGVVDDSSRIIFNVKEDLGGGMAAIVQLDMRIKPDDNGVTGAANTAGVVSGNSFFGLNSSQWGTITLGRNDLHYFNRESNLTDKASLRADSISLLAFAGGGAIPVANATRTQNVVRYLSPNWSGFTFILAYSSNPSATDADITSPRRRGYAWNFNPNYQAANWQVGWSYWNSKPDVGSAGAPAVNPLPSALDNQEANRLYGSYVFPFGLKIGLAWDESKLKNVQNGIVSSKRTVWSLPIGYSWGNHNVYFHYDQAGNDKAPLASAANLDTKAHMWAIAYAYDLSKRTSVAVTWSEIKNHSAAAYNFFTSGALGLGNSAPKPGENPQMFGVTMRHAF